MSVVGLAFAVGAVVVVVVVAAVVVVVVVFVLFFAAARITWRHGVWSNLVAHPLHTAPEEAFFSLKLSLIGRSRDSDCKACQC